MEIKPDLSICAVVDGQFKAVERLVRSIISTADPVAVEIIVANTAGPSLAAENFVNGFPNITYFDLAGVSTVQAKNHVMRLTAGRFVGLFDSDQIVQENCLKNLIDYMDDHPDIGVAGPQIVNAYGVLERTARSFHSVPAVLGQSVARNVLPDFLWKHKHYIDDWNHRTTREVDWLCGGTHIIRRELIEDVGLFTEHLPFFYEEEYYIRSQKSGWHNYYIYEAQVIHPNPGRYTTIADTSTAKGFSAHEAVRFFYRKWLGPKVR